MAPRSVRYQQLQERIELLRQRHPTARFHVRIDCAGQYAVNLERFLRDLPLALEISVGEPARNAAYRKAHLPKRKNDSGDSFATARYAVVECPPPTPDLPPEFAALREVASRLESQVVQTTRFVCQLHNLLARVFPELATLVAEIRAHWVLAMLARYPTPARISRAKPESLTTLPYAKPEKIAAIQTAARTSVGMLKGEVAETLVCQLVRDIQASKKNEKCLETLMKQAFAALPSGSHHLLTTIKGIGPATAAALVAKVVSIDRFATPAQLVSYFGLFPEEHTSGYDRDGKNWAWIASTDNHSSNGFVGLSDLLRILEFKPNYTMRGLGERQSGLKEITKSQFEQLLALFRAAPRNGGQISQGESPPPGHWTEGGGEGPVHLALKQYVAANPVIALGEQGVTTIRMEFPFGAGDRADIALQDQIGRFIGLEIEVEQNEGQLEGLLQAIKYRYMLAVMQRVPFEESRSVLLAYRIAPGIKRLCGDYDVQVIELDRATVEAWHTANPQYGF